MFTEIAKKLRNFLPVYSNSADSEEFKSRLELSVREKTLVRWCNINLRSKGFEVETLSDFDDGFLLIILLEILSGKKLHDDTYTEESASDATENWFVVHEHLIEENLDLSTTFGKFKLSVSIYFGCFSEQQRCLGIFEMLCIWAIFIILFTTPLIFLSYLRDWS